jgi:hypothetical protein
MEAATIINEILTMFDYKIVRKLSILKIQLFLNYF